MKMLEVHVSKCSEACDGRAVYTVTIGAAMTPTEQTRLEAVRRGEMKIVSMGFRAVKNEELKL